VAGERKTAVRERCELTSDSVENFRSWYLKCASADELRTIVSPQIRSANRTTNVDKQSLGQPKSQTDRRVHREIVAPVVGPSVSCANGEEKAHTSIESRVCVTNAAPNMRRGLGTECRLRLVNGSPLEGCFEMMF
jgi:hypothetical protein